jgi:hypothetical protein
VKKITGLGESLVWCFSHHSPVLSVVPCGRPTLRREGAEIKPMAGQQPFESPQP